MGCYWVIFIICCFGLWLPGFPGFALRKEQKFRRLKPEGPWDLILTYIPNWTDLLRAGAFSWVLMQWFQGFLAANPPEKSRTALGAVLGCMMVGTLIQCLFIKHRRIFVIPTFYVLGLALFVAGWEIGLLAAAGAFGISYGLRQPSAILPVLGVLLVVGGYVIKAPILQLAVGGMVAYLPLFICLFFNKTGVLPAHVLIGRSEVETPNTGPETDLAGDESSIVP